MPQDTSGMEALLSLQQWLQVNLSTCPGVVVAFSGSYTSAVGLQLLRTAFKGPIDVTHVIVGEYPWRKDMCEGWRKHLKFRKPFRYLKMEQVASIFEDEIEDLYATRSVLTTDLITMSLKFLATATKRPLLWFGDRNVVAVQGIPSMPFPVIAPFAHLDHSQVRELGRVLRVSDSWAISSSDIPATWYQEICDSYHSFDKAVGVWLAHQGDFSESGQDPNNVSDHKWVGIGLEDNFQVVLLDEILLRSETSRRIAPVTRMRQSTLLWERPFDLFLLPDRPAEALLVGSISFGLSPRQEKSKPLLQVEGITTSGRAIVFWIYPSLSNIAILKSSSGRVLHLHLYRGDEDSKMVSLSLSPGAEADLQFNLGKLLDGMGK